MSKNEEHVCIAEFEKWLDFKKIGTAKRKRNKDMQEIVVGAMMEGNLTIDTEGVDGNPATFNMDYSLVFPVGKEGNELSKITIPPRLATKQRGGLKNIDPGDSDRRVCTLLGALAGAHTGVLLEADSSTDMEAFAAIAMYFL
jgi:hypothetical protein